MIIALLLKTSNNQIQEHSVRQMLSTTVPKLTWLASSKMPISRVMFFKIKITSREVFCPQEWKMHLDLQWHQLNNSQWQVVSNLNQDSETNLVQICHHKIKDNFSQEWILKWTWIKANSKLTFSHNNQWWEVGSKVRIQCRDNSNFKLGDRLAKWTKWVSYRTFKLNNKTSKKNSEIASDWSCKKIYKIKIAIEMRNDM